MIAKGAIGLNVIDDDDLSVRSNFVADGRFNLQFATFDQTEVYVVAHRATNPSVGGYARDGNEAHAGNPAHGVQDFRDSINLLNGVYVSLQVSRHHKPATCLLFLTLCSPKAPVGTN
jgi:hypothetical protein